CPAATAKRPNARLRKTPTKVHRRVRLADRPGVALVLVDGQRTTVGGLQRSGVGQNTSAIAKVERPTSNVGVDDPLIHYATRAVVVENVPSLAANRDPRADYQRASAVTLNRVVLQVVVATGAEEHRPIARQTSSRIRRIPKVNP